MSEKIKTQPKFIKEFSKQESAQERKQTAQKIKAKRAEYFSEKEDRIEEQAKSREKTKETESNLAEQLKKIQELGEKIEDLSNFGLTKLLNYFELKKLRADISIGQKSYEELKQEQERAIQQEEIQTAQVETPPELQEAKEMLDNFYKEQKEKWANSEYTKEDITKYFSEEHLASLSLEDYALLLKRFPSEMVTHVTRQGVRDHFGLWEHTAGKGEYSDGFMKILKDGRLRSPLAVHLIKNTKEEAIAKFLDLENFKTKEDALKYLASFTDPEAQGISGIGTYADSSSIHFATEYVADFYYGAEKGNEIFMAFPSAHIASQYYFQGNLVRHLRDSKSNDQWVWANEERGMGLNASIVFIPENTAVDKETGSRYELDENKNRVINPEHIETIRKVVESDDFQDFASQVLAIWDKFKGRYMPEEFVPFCQKLEQKFGIDDGCLQAVLLNKLNLLTFLENREQYKDGQEKSINLIIKNVLQKEKEQRWEGRELYLEAQNTIRAEEFWENYFVEHPDQRPSKIVYYQGNDPTDALKFWKIKQSLDKRSEEEQDLGFSERRISGDSPQATAGMNRFRSIGEKVIEDYFESK